MLNGDGAVAHMKCDVRIVDEVQIGVGGERSATSVNLRVWRLPMDYVCNLQHLAWALRLRYFCGVGTYFTSATRLQHREFPHVHKKEGVLTAV